MKKQIIVSMLTVAAVFCSCSKQDDLSQTLGNDEQQVTFTLSAADVQTRAETEVPLDRYVMEVYTDAACTEEANVFENGTKHRKEQTTATFELILNSKKSYYCLFWADNAAAAVYDVTTLQKVTLKADANPLEGFHAMLTVTKAQANHPVKLTRAVAKVTLNEKDKIEAGSSLKTTYDRCNSFNVATATAGDAKNVEITTQITAPVEGTVDVPVWLGEFFTFASGNNVTFSFTLNNEPEKLVTNVPLKTNFVTNIKGEFSGLTSKTLEATASDDWNEMDIEVDATTLTTDELKTMLTTTTAKYWTINGTVTSDADAAISTAVGDALKVVYNADNAKRISATLPDVTTIEEYSFKFNDNLVAISLPKATTINYQGFFSCLALTSISMPEVISLGNSALNNCENLTSVYLPKVETVGLEAFYDCGKLPTLSLPKATVIGDGAFAKTYALTTLTFGSVIESWGKDVFRVVSLAQTELRDLTLKRGQRQPLGGDTWNPACTGDLVEEGEGKTFAGYTFKSITLVD